MTIISLLSQILGKGRHFGKSEYYYSCPFCHHKNPKLAVNIENNRWQCWHCKSRGKSILSLFRKIDATKEQISQLRSLITDTDVRTYKEDTSESSKLYLPKEFISLAKKNNSYEYKHAISYLKGRGISVYDILRYNIGYCEDGPYKGRVIIPSYDIHNQLNYFIGRNYHNGGINYKNPPISKNTVIFENVISWNLGYITIVEGVFDAIAIRHNVVPILGTRVPNKLLYSVLYNKIKRVNVCLDSDALKDSLEICRNLIDLGVEVHHIKLENGEDPASMGFEKISHLIRNSKKMSSVDVYKNIINLKLAI